MCDIFGGSDPEPQYVTQTTSSDPWGPQQEPLKFGFEEARRIYDANTPQYYEGPTVVGFSPQSEQALSQMEDRALAGSPLTAAGQNAILGAARGDYLNSNPYFDQVVQQALDPVQQRVMSQFGGAGRYGSGINQQVMAQEMGDVAARMYANNYETERGRQMQAAAMAPQMAMADYQDIGQLANVGAAREAMSQAELSDAVNRWNFEQNREANKLGQYMAMISGGYGGTQSASQPVFSNSAAQFLGGAASGAGIGNMIGGGWGAGIGAGIGGLLSL